MTEEKERFRVINVRISYHGGLMDKELIEECLAAACASLLRDNEGIVIIINENKYLLWYDAEEKFLKLNTFNVNEENIFEDASMTKKIDSVIHGQKVWIHEKPN